MKNRSSCRTDAIERFALAQAVMSQLNSSDTHPDTSAAKDYPNNQFQKPGCFTKADRRIQKMDDLWFSVDTARTVDLNTVAVSAEIAALPDVAGMGNLKSLRHASNDSAWRTFA